MQQGADARGEEQPQVEEKAGPGWKSDYDRSRHQRTTDNGQWAMSDDDDDNTEANDDSVPQSSNKRAGQ